MRTVKRLARSVGRSFGRVGGLTDRRTAGRTNVRTDARAVRTGGRMDDRTDDGTGSLVGRTDGRWVGRARSRSFGWMCVRDGRTDSGQVVHFSLQPFCLDIFPSHALFSPSSLPSPHMHKNLCAEGGICGLKLVCAFACDYIFEPTPNFKPTVVLFSLFPPPLRFLLSWKSSELQSRQTLSLNNKTKPPCLSLHHHTHTLPTLLSFPTLLLHTACAIPSTSHLLIEEAGSRGAGKSCHHHHLASSLSFSFSFSFSFFFSSSLQTQKSTLVDVCVGASRDSPLFFFLHCVL